MSHWKEKAAKWNAERDAALEACRDIDDLEEVQARWPRSEDPSLEADGTGSEKGSALRHNHGKPNLALIPLCTLEDEARVWEHGAKKYTEYNWMKGMKWSIVQASLLRHLSAWQSGQDLDPESGLPHLAHMACNIRMLTLFAKTYPEGDDRPPKELL